MADPILSIAAATNITTTSATLNGSLDSMGDEVDLDLSFDYGFSTEYGLSTGPEAVTEAGNFSANLTDLDPETRYHFRLAAFGSGGWYYSEGFFFTTSDPDPPDPPDPPPIPPPPGDEKYVEVIGDKTDAWVVDNKDQGAWSFTKSPIKNRYNEGSSIATSADPTWDTYNFTGDPITTGHDPCGYWPAGTIPYRYVPPEADIPIAIAGVGECISWSGTLGGQYGRFVKGRTYGQVHYSDDGGFTWTRCDGGLFSAFHDIRYTIFALGYFFVVSLGGKIGRSADGINWTVITKAIGSLYYSYDFDTFFTHLGTYGRYAGVSNDLCSNWTQKTAMGSYGSYTGNVAYLGKHYFFAYNYNYMYESSDGNTWTASTVTPWSLNPGSIRRGVFLADNYLYYSNCVFDGISWSSTGVPFRYGAYKANLGYVCTANYDVKWAASNFSDSQVVHTDSGNTLRDICWGNDRWVAVSPSRVVVGVIKPGYFEVSHVPAVYEHDYKTGGWRTKFTNLKGQVPWTI